MFEQLSLMIDGNIVFSPASIYLALGLTGLGASGECEDEFWKVLGCENKKDLGK